MCDHQDLEKKQLQLIQSPKKVANKIAEIMSTKSCLMGLLMMPQAASKMCTSAREKNRIDSRCIWSSQWNRKPLILLKDGHGQVTMLTVSHFDGCLEGDLKRAASVLFNLA